VVSVSSTTSESLMDTCERIMADPNLLAVGRRGTRPHWAGVAGYQLGRGGGVAG
jgi:hypothetical protein